MIKGAQKKMIVVKTTDSKLFEEAYFVLRREAENDTCCDMVAEANRIIENCDGKKSRRGGKRIKERLMSAAFFVVSGALGGAIVGLITFLA